MVYPPHWIICDIDSFCDSRTKTDATSKFSSGFEFAHDSDSSLYCNMNSILWNHYKYKKYHRIKMTRLDKLNISIATRTK